MGLKLNIGSGYKRFEGFLNVDDDPLVEPDYIVNLDDVNIKLPFEDNSVEEIKAHHILEHIGEGFIPLMKEMYRVCQDGAILDIAAPHHQHEVFYGDPTHKRPITVNAMLLFDKQRCLEHIESHGSSSGMALKYGIDFRIESFDFIYDPFYHEYINNVKEKQAKGELTPVEEFAYVRLMREATNVAQDVLIKMKAVK